ncbi:hypothetical protein H7J07_12580 [Mycobacterium koreense]|uniref:Uncharacterized protein n=1 Tax=Mycolicibacillus koreensis TaxID=1069220 RepID=A0A7I7SF01_9MYCO|nr:hypothetical protein [Mycolicibacillus koreensis]MCV7249051.1 hypothetical protein [Mycolicibacillus koreensis]OSC34103.1 hypothetical protein B8W67_08075 [Mycolicibacillus koreensis]BBY54565.1 hypothetical protein MKOR_18160 [Mycolicibacillus koreensis]
MSPRPPVTRLVLYKHGMAFVDRRGPIDGEFSLTFRREDMKDVLKSLVLDVADGQVSMGAITFDTPADPDEQLADRRLRFDSGKALLGLLDGLRGRAVEVRCGARRHRGEVIGVDDGADHHRSATGTGRHLVLRTDAGEIGLVDLAEADGLTMLDDSSRADLEYLIDRFRAATGGANCEVGVAVRGKARDARIAYLVAAPMWRVSYRILSDGDRLRLAAMGILHNPIDEDLTDVEVTLTTGQPISFEIDLYQARRVHRVAREERERVFAPQPPGAMVRSAAMLTGVDAYEQAAEEVASADRGQYFEYRLTSPISLKRGGAAMVPLAVASVSDVHRELVWRQGFGPAPEVALAFSNTTDLVLEEGPAVVYEHDGYAGEAMVDFTARGAPVRLGFAKDLAVRCSAVERHHTVTTRVRLASEALIEECREERRHTLRAQNDHDHPVEVIFEVPRVVGHHIADHDGATLDGEDGEEGEDGADPDWHRFRVAVPAHQLAEATVVEAWPVRREIDYEDLAPGRLESWLAGRSLDAETVAALSGVLAHWEQAGRLDGQREQTEATRADLYEAQHRITEQLSVLGTDGDEGRLRSRQVGELAGLQDRVGELDTQVHRLRAEADAARTAATDALHRLIS